MPRFWRKCFTGHIDKVIGADQGMKRRFAPRNGCSGGDCGCSRPFFGNASRIDNSEDLRRFEEHLDERGSVYFGVCLCGITSSVVMND